MCSDLIVICYDCARRARQCPPLWRRKMFHGVCDSTAIAGRLQCNRPAIPYQSSVSMFHAAWRLILVMQVTLGTGLCLEFTTRILKTAFLSQPASLGEVASTDARPSRSPHKAEGLSAVSASHTYHLCGSISSAALREKSDNQGQHWVSTKKWRSRDVSVQGRASCPSCTGYASPYIT